MGFKYLLSIQCSDNLNFKEISKLKLCKSPVSTFFMSISRANIDMYAKVRL